MRFLRPPWQKSKSIKIEDEVGDQVPTCLPGKTIDLTSEGPDLPFWEFE